MNFDYPAETLDRLEQLDAFMTAHVYPAEADRLAWDAEPANLWRIWPGLEPRKAAAREAGLWNLFLPLDYGELSGGLSNLEYAPMAERMGRVPWASELFNCSAPDTGNMEVLARYGTAAQKERWLAPLLAGSIRSAYLMTEPGVASSDATNLETRIVRDGSDYVVSGRKWFITGILDPRCEILLVMGKSDPGAARHQQHSTILVPRDSAGVKIVREQRVFGHTRTPEGEAEVLLEDVRVPADHLILGEGRGFEIAQGRLGPGRIHHCMRSIGQAQRALELMIDRAEARTAFGRRLSEQASIQQDIARSFCEIEQARLLTLKAASRLDQVGNREAMDLIAAIKIVAPRMAQLVTDRAMQVFGAMGVSDDTPIANLFLINRYLRIADGPDEVHLSQLARLKIKERRQLSEGAVP